MEERARKLIEDHKDDKDLSSMDLSGWDFSGVDFGGWNLSKCNLKKAIFYTSDDKGEEIKSKLIKADLHEAYLWNANLQKADLSCADLQKADLYEANLQGAHLDYAHLKEAYLYYAHLKEASLCYADLLKTNLWNANLQKADLSGANLRDSEFNNGTILENINLFQAKLENSTLRFAINNLCVINEQEKKCINEIDGEYRQAKECYRNLKNYCRQEGLYDESGKFYYREKLIEKKLHKKNKRWGKWISSNLYHYLAGYGEHPLWVLWWWFVTILFFGSIYWTGGISRGVEAVQWYENYYFSVVTFTTLGFGDIQPQAGMWHIQLCAMIEALLGAILMALFILTFGRKMMR